MNDDPKDDTRHGMVRTDNIIQLNPNKPDAELAEELKQEILENLKPVLVSATKALRQGFQIQLNMAPNAFKEVVVQQLQLLKIF